MQTIKKILNFILDSFKFVIVGIFKVIGIILGFILGPIFAPKNDRSKSRVIVLLIVVASILSFFYVFPKYFNNTVDKANAYKENIAKSESLVFKSKGFDQWLGNWQFPYFYTKEFTLGLDLKGGTHLVYQADLSNISSSEYLASMDGVKDVIERRVNAYGVSEPLVQTSQVGSEYRIIVDLADVKDVNEAIKMIGETPFLEFKEEKTQEEIEDERKTIKENLGTSSEGDATENKVALEALDVEGNVIDGMGQIEIDPSQEIYVEPFKSSELNGKHLEKAEVVSSQYTSESQVSLRFDNEGKKLFSEITQRNVGKRIAIYLDGVIISAPVVNEPILDGRAVIQGNFTIEEARQLSQRLNAGALPVPIKLIGQQNIEASLGKNSLEKSLKAGIVGFIAVMIFMLVYYKFLGFFADLALIVYALISLMVFKLIPITLTLPGIAGFILSVGMAVDANVLIFERIKESLTDSRKTLETCIEEGFVKAWPSIRDGNVSTLISCAILFMFASSSVKGFALTLTVGILASMFSAIVITKAFIEFAILSKIIGWTKNINSIWKAGYSFKRNSKE